MDEDGKIDGKRPVFNDILAFIWNKMQTCPKEPLLKVAKDFYKIEEISSARNLLFTTVPSDTRRTKHKSAQDMLGSMYDIFQQLPTGNDLVFVAWNLNHIPSVSLSNIDAAALVHQQTSLTTTVSGILEENKMIKHELSAIKALLANLSGADRLAPGRESLTSDANRCASMSSSGDNINVLSSQDTRNSGNVSYARSLLNHPPHRRPPPPQTREEVQRETDDSTWRTVQQRKRRRNRNEVTGNRAGSELGVVTRVKKCAIFVSRLGPQITAEKVKAFVDQIISNSCEVEKLNTRYDSYSSFRITCEEKYNDKVLDPDMWEEGVLIRKFFGPVVLTRDSDQP